MNNDDFFSLGPPNPPAPSLFPAPAPGAQSPIAREQPPLPPVIDPAPSPNTGGLRQNPPGSSSISSGPEKVNDKSSTQEKEKEHDALLEELDDVECYHGNMLEEDVKNIMNKHGDFIIRTMNNADGTKKILLTILWQKEMLDLPIKIIQSDNKKKSSYSIDSTRTYLTIKELIKNHQMMSEPVTIGRGKQVMLLNPVAKQSWELRSDNVTLVKKLGEGAFGEVYSGKLKLRMQRFCNVAIKVIKRCANTDKATRELQKEAAIMRKFKHVNIVRFYGMVFEREKIMIVMELITGGGLDNYLKKNKDKIGSDERGTYAYDIASGLAFLHAENCIHRDIACRNCLIDLYRKVAKVSDFGLAKQTDEYKVTPEDRLPVRWTAPEVFSTGVYTRAADIYAYGILVWEIFNDAANPFGALTNAQIKAGIQKEDFRPEFSTTTPADVVSAVSKCWKQDPKERPELADLTKGPLVKYKRTMPLDEKAKTSGPTAATKKSPKSSDKKGQKKNPKSKESLRVRKNSKNSNEQKKK